MEMEINGCHDCVFCSSSYDELFGGLSSWTHACMVAVKLQFENILTEKDDEGMPITPDWCPLKRMEKINVLWK